MHELVDFPGRVAVKVKSREMPCFTYPWHFHSEYEILYILDGCGTSFVADSIESFKSGDLVMLGNNLPHFWRSDESYYSESLHKKVKYIVIQFPKDLFRESIFQYAEFNSIKVLLDYSARGIRFLPPFSGEAGKKIIALSEKSGFERMILFLQLLESMAGTENYRLLAGELYHTKIHEFSGDRLNKVMHYINMTYRRRIGLKEASEIANLHPAAFSRFFKEKTGKTFIHFVNNMRIGYACKLIIEGQLSFSEVCYESGFNNISNFNRTFRQQTGFSPTEYHAQFNRK